MHAHNVLQCADLKNIFEKPDINGNTILHTVFAESRAFALVFRDWPEFKKQAELYPVTTLKTAIAAKAQLNTQNLAGQTPLMVAIMYKDYCYTSLLLEANADISIADKEGKTAINYAQQQPSILALLQKSSPKGLQKSGG